MIVPIKAIAQIPVVILRILLHPAIISTNNSAIIIQNKIFPVFFIALF